MEKQKQSANALALVQISGREAGCLFFCSPFITFMKTLIAYIPPELSSAGDVKKFLRWLSVEIRGFWEPKCPGCGSKRVRRDRRAPEDGPSQCRGTSVPRGKKLCDRTGTPTGSTPPQPGSSRPSPSSRVGLSFRAASRTLEVSHVTVVRWCMGLELRRIRGHRRWVGDETFVRVAGKTMYQGSGWLTGGAALSRGSHAPRRKETEAGMVLSQGRPRGCGKP